MLVVFTGEKSPSGKKAAEFQIYNYEIQLASAWMSAGPYVPVASSSSSDTVEYGG